MDALFKHVEKTCRSRGKVLTEKRRLVFSALIHSKKALSVYELVDYCKDQFNTKIQPMSVYRILDFLEAEHLAHKLNASNKYIVCSHIQSEEEHGISQFLICSRCNKIIEQIIDPNLLMQLQSKAQADGFTVISTQLEIDCICDDCTDEKGAF